MAARCGIECLEHLGCNGQVILKLANFVALGSVWPRSLFLANYVEIGALGVFG